jgi:hypothetical protein
MGEENRKVPQGYTTMYVPVSATLFAVAMTFGVLLYFARKRRARGG